MEARQEYVCLLCGSLIQTAHFYKKMTFHLRKHHQCCLEEYVTCFLHPQPRCLRNGCDTLVTPTATTRRSRDGFWHTFCSLSCRTSHLNAFRKEEQAEVLRGLWTSEDFRERQAQSARQFQEMRWDNPDTRRKESLRAMDRVRNPEDAFGRYVTEVRGTLLRSEDGEGTLARCFENLGLEWKYESEVIPLSDGIHHYLPDFYLPSYEIYIEFRPSERTDASLLRKLRDVSRQGYAICLFDREDIQYLSQGQSAAKLEELLSSRRFRDYSERK